jgi:hypothetical protein
VSTPKPRIVWPDRYWIEEQYHLRSIRDIAAEIGCSPMGLHSHMRRQGIAIREKPPSKRKKRAEASE